MSRPTEKALSELGIPSKEQMQAAMDKGRAARAAAPEAARSLVITTIDDGGAVLTINENGILASINLTPAERLEAIANLSNIPATGANG